MCGIVAIATADRSRFERTILERMRDAIAHRGPDDAGIFSDEGIALAHRRLSIIDLASGHQPMADFNKRAWIVFNGEIYNFKELRREFTQRGYKFETTSDTEVILASYLLDGDSFLEKLNGIFALALWDINSRRLVLARDRLGVKPLYLWKSPMSIAAASEIKALLECPAIAAEAEEELIPEYLAFRQLSGHRTLFRGIECLPPGSILSWQDGYSHIRQYWKLPPIQASGKASLSDCLEEVEDLIEEACRIQLMSDVPLGTYNSGGIDSSLVTRFVAQEAQDGLNTFCVGLSEAGHDERPFAERVAREFGTHHHQIVVENEEFSDALPAMIWHHDEPLNHPNTVAMYLLSKEAKRKVTVVLTGEGADELFAGYPRYRLGAAFDILGDLGVNALGKVFRYLDAGHSAKWEQIKRALLIGPGGALVEAPRYVVDGSIGQILVGDLEPTHLHRLPATPPPGSTLSKMLEYDQQNYLLSVLNRLDKASMAFGVEARVPFLDHRIVELAASLPISLKMRHFETKYVLKRVAERHLPKEVVYRRKSGLSLPLRTWFSAEMGLGRYLDLLIEPRSLQRPYFQPEAVRAMVKAQRSEVADHTQLIWGLVNLELWHRAFVD